MEPQSDTEQWLSLSEAARQLNIHVTTLRRWADHGDIPVLITPGGHRRFASSDISRFAQERRNMTAIASLPQIWADQAMIHTRQEMNHHPEQPWLTHLDTSSRETSRQLGQQLMGLTLQFLSDNSKKAVILQEAHKIGRQYGQLCREWHLPLTEALQASIFFRDTLIETALHLPENVHIQPEANLRLLRRINQLLNTVHLAVAEVYDEYSTNPLSEH
ncbi:MAG: helix-turn-helix domain-containing protein [Anaerolineae bacterium]|nr:helix-turn-helix domain-containing protein [Anaerolineae bacterium]